MLESYEQEISRKRRATRFFWFLVFSFATFLYFFFQGYYPAFDITWKQVFNSGGVRDISREELIRSFGIINVRVYPKNAVVNISGDAYGFDEKKMVPYGKYRLSVGKPGYIQDRVRFEIDRKTPYFISEIHLVPQAKYEKIGSGIVHISKIEEDTWITVEGRTHLLYDKYFLTGSRIPASGAPIGEGYFLSGTTIYTFQDSVWEKKNWSGSVNLIRNCSTGVEIVNDVLWCRANGDAISSNGFLYRKINKIYPNYLLGEDSLFADKTEFPLNKQERLENQFINYEGTWYTPNGGLLIPLVSNTKKTSVPLIETSLDSISALRMLDGNLVVFGKKGVDTFAVFRKNGELFRIPFPDISLEGLEIMKSKGNIYFRSDAVLLFLYDGSEKIEWLTEGEILAHSDVAALYRKDGELWRVSWGAKME